MRKFSARLLILSMVLLLLLPAGALAAVPGIVTNPDVTPGDQQLEVTWGPPDNDGGNPIDHYEISHTQPVVYYETDSDSSHTITGLTNGTAYSIMIRAVNSDGPGAVRQINDATPYTLPDAPANLEAIAGNGKVTLNWTAPANNGGADLWYYNVYKNNMQVSTLGANTLTYDFNDLENGTEYTLGVAAQNIAGNSTMATITATPGLAKPGVPQNITVTPADGRLTIFWNAPADNGGSEIIRYEVKIGSESDPWIYNSLSTFKAFDGLTNGQTYTMYVRAVNAVGESDAVTITGIPAAAPGAPQKTTAVAGYKSIKLSWEAPANDGGSPITGYWIKIGNNNWVELGNKFEYTFTDLTIGKEYTVYVRARNAVDYGPQISRKATPIDATTPGYPDTLTATGGDGSITMNWTPPSNDGGSPVTGYEVRIGNGAPWQDVGNVLTHTENGLTNGTLYALAVRAYNAIGVGSSYINATATPVGKPEAPANVAATPGDRKIDLTWGLPPSNGGASIEKYIVYIDGAKFHQILPSAPRGWTFTGLTNGQEYEVGVSAVNANGESPIVTQKATPTFLASVPGEPETFTATAGDGSATMNWTPPADDGGSPILGYKVRVRLNNNTDGWDGWEDVGNVLTCTKGGLTNGQAYHLSVKAYNAVGDSLSYLYFLVTPTDVPLPPAAPVINTPAADDDTLTGTGVPGATITATVGGSGHYTTTVTAQGSWIVSVPALKGGDVVSVTQTVGTLTSPAATATVDTPVPNVPLNIEPIYEGDTVLRGTSNQEGATIYVYENVVSAAIPRHTIGAGAAGALLGTDIVTNGRWSVTLPHAYKADDTFIVQAVMNNVPVATEPAVVQPIPGPVPTPTEAAATKADPIYPYGNGTISGSSVNGREAPSMDAKVLRKFQAGTAIEIVEWGFTGADGSGPWCKIIYNDTIYFVHSNFVNGQAR